MGSNHRWPKEFFERLRRPPTRRTVRHALPVLFFGDILRARYVTVGLNPSDQEYVDRSGSLLDGALRRFETLRSLRAKCRDELTPRQCRKAFRTMQRYFLPSKPVYSWFRPLDRVLNGFGVSFSRGQAVHLDLVQESTSPTWSALYSETWDEADNLLRADLPFLKAQLARLRPLAILCNGRTVLDEVAELFETKIVRRGSLKRLTWSAGVVRLPHGHTKLVGWNIPLTRPPGLTSEGQIRFGKMLRQVCRGMTQYEA